MLLAFSGSACHAGALQAELWPQQIIDMKVIAINLKQFNHYTSILRHTQFAGHSPVNLRQSFPMPPLQRFKEICSLIIKYNSI
tara:strand:- start:152 stop:400 length:249 start_codon:yes stop_codon:yes gene_type:complete